MTRSACAVTPLLVLAIAITGSAGAQPPELSVHARCERRASPGRVTCEVELEVPRGTLSWADVLVSAAPDFAPPLRARVGPGEVVMKTPRRQRLRLALAATAEGQGSLFLTGRGVHCPQQPREHCRAVSAAVVTDVAVGPITPDPSPDQ